MRAPAGSAKVFAFCISLQACGGAHEGSTGAASAFEPAHAPSPNEVDAAAQPTEPTTTVAPAEHGPAGGTKLSESNASAPPAPAELPPHTHDPGRRPQDIAAIVVAHRPEARACYEKALEAHPTIEGDLVVQWTIDPKGTVTQIDLDMSRSTLVEGSVVACVEDVVKRIKFAPSPGGYETKAYYPFNFRRHGGPRGKGP